MFNQVGRKIYYDKATGNVIVDTGEMQGYVRDTTVEEDFQRYEALRGLNKASVGVLKLQFGQFAQDFAQATGYRVNSAGKLEFSYGPAGQPPVYQRPLTEQVEELRAANLKTQNETLIALDVAASLYEELLMLKMQLEGSSN